MERVIWEGVVFPCKEVTIMDGIIKDETVFTHRYIPSAILHREKQIMELSARMSCPLDERPAKNTIIYGWSGTGKTLITKLLANELSRKTQTIRTCYVRLKGAQTEHKAANRISKALIGEQFEGRSASAIYSKIFDYIIKHVPQKYIVFVMDEVDGVEKGCDTFLDVFLRPYENFPALGEKEISVILISNRMTFPEGLSIGTKSVFDCIDKLVFEPYNANQLRSIMVERAEKGLYEGTYDELVIPLCAAYGAQEHGDARRTIELLGKAAKVALTDGAKCITEVHVKKAYEMIEFEGIAQVLKTLPSQSKAVALAISRDSRQNQEITTSSIYKEYLSLCQQAGISPLTQRRIVDLLDELETLGLIRSQVIYKGKYGRNRHVNMLVPHNIIEQVLTEDIRFEQFRIATERRPATGLERFVRAESQ